jgi:hypothetical protein
MNAVDFSDLSDAEKRHFYKCRQCGEMVEKRQLDEVLFHETDHKPRADIQYGGSERLGESKQ